MKAQSEMGDASAAEFRFGLFCSTTTDASLLSERARVLLSDSADAEPAGFPYWRPSNALLFSVGMVLEERMLLAQGAASAVFPRDEVARWLRDDDQSLQTLRELVADHEYLLPPFLTADELLSHETGRGADEFRSTLFFRDDEREFDLDSYHSELLLGSDEQWSLQMVNARAEVEEIFSSDAPRLNVLSNVFDSVMVCANLLSYFADRPQGSLNPWSVAIPDLRLDNPGVDSDAGPEADETTEKPLRSAFELLRELNDELHIDLEAEGGAQLAESPAALLGILSIKYWLIAAMPARTLYRRLSDAAAVVQTITSREVSSAIVNAGPEASFGLAAWRLAPSDSRSLSRQSEAVGLLLETLRRLQDENIDVPLAT
jgi:hypothetical protein